jgi:hypothetical protein
MKRFHVVTFVVGAAALALTGLWLVRPSAAPQRPAVRAGGSPASRPPVPVFAVAPSPALDRLSPPSGMSEGLAADLKMFDNTQLRAELQSIATSYPDVVLGAVACAALPCSAEASSQDAEQLDGFVQMVSARFQGHLRTQLRRRPRAGRTWIEAGFLIGTPERHAPSGGYSR